MQQSLTVVMMSPPPDVLYIYFALRTGEPLELMVQFFVKFGDKPCCITDLNIYLHLLAADQHEQVSRVAGAISRPDGPTSIASLPSCRVQFAKRLSEAAPLGQPGPDGLAFPDDTKALQRHMCVCQLSRALGLHHALDAAAKLRLVAELKAHYRHGLKFGEEHGGSIYLAI